MIGIVHAETQTLPKSKLARTVRSSELRKTEQTGPNWPKQFVTFADVQGSQDGFQSTGLEVELIPLSMVSLPRFGR